ncbi:MAG: lamin tail domain-containing protein, partial [bacterium]|nr:lamin tail domain-containing protein [bacterium]
ARKFDGYNTFNNLNDFAETSKPTKGVSNIIETEDEVSAEVKAKFDFSSDIYISEILPNPVGDDTKLEFIEIYNAGQREVNLTGWSLSNKDDKKVNLEKIATSTIIKAGEYLAFFRTRTKIVLHNDKGQVKLFQPLADKPLAVVDYKNVKEGWSYNLKTPLTPLLKGGSINGEWVWSETPTPGAANVIKAVNHAPEAEFNLPAQVLIGAPVIFDSSDTFDQDDDKLIFSWDFGDGFNNSLANPEHTYFNAGIYKVKLAVSDGKATSTKEKSVKVVNGLGEMIGAETPLTPLLKGGANPPNPLYQGGTVIINEIFPNPAGADTGQEWLELINQSEIEINLLNWRVENSNGKYGFKSERVLESGAFYVLDNAISKLAFKNTSDVINLYNDLDELADQVEYASAIQGEAYARGINGNWFWTTKITPGEENIISLAQSEASLEYQASGIKAAAGEYVETDLEKVREMEIGSLVKVKGTVAVEPGILGVQIFYIVGSPGIQIYNYKKDFPALRIGDYIEVTGELAQTQGELRIKTKDKNDINLIEYKAPPAALAIKAEEVNEENIGQLITVTGEITDKKSTSLYVDDGSDE